MPYTFTVIDQEAARRYPCLVRYPQWYREVRTVTVSPAWLPRYLMASVSIHARTTRGDLGVFTFPAVNEVFWLNESGYRTYMQQRVPPINLRPIGHDDF